MDSNELEKMAISSVKLDSRFNQAAVLNLNRDCGNDCDNDCGDTDACDGDCGGDCADVTCPSGAWWNEIILEEQLKVVPPELNLKTQKEGEKICIDTEFLRY